ncbi:hypothetical protein BsWGS_27799 [Bradybaena similaris]
MEMLKLLNEAKANGLSKDEFFQLIDLELKMNESKKQASGGVVSSGDNLACGNSNLEKLVQDTFENQQKQQRQMLLEMKQFLHNEFQQFQKQLLQQQDVQLRQHQQVLAQQIELLKCNLQGKGESSGKSDAGLDSASLNLKDRFFEMRNTVLNRLEEEKVFMRDALSKAQNDILTLLSKTGQEVSQIKEAVGAEEIAQIGKQVSQIRLLCEEQSLQKNVQDDQGCSTEGPQSSQVIQDSLKTLLEDLKTKIEGKLDESVDSLKQEVKNIKEAQAAKLPDKAVVLAGSKHRDDNSISYYFCINNFQNCLKYEQSIDNSLMYIEKLRVYVKGYVQFVSGEMEVWLSYVNNPSKPSHSVQSLTVPPGTINVNAAIVDLTGNLPDKDVGEKSFSCDTLSLNSERPYLIGRVTCNQVIADGYASYSSGAILLKYTLVVQVAY